MRPVADLSALSAAPDELWPELREAFQRAGYLGGVLDEAEDIAAGQVEQVRVPLVRWALLELGRPDATLAALFVYGASVDRARVAAVLGDGLVGRLLAAGVLRADGGGDGDSGVTGGEALSAELRVTPFHGVWILSDELWRDGDPVMGPSMTTEILRRALPTPLRGRTLLDVGCGAGSLAIWAAAQGAHAVATDISPRAVELTRLNALLNAVPCEVGAGDLTRPVAGRAFDLVVSQPPFLIKPPDLDAVTFLHGGATGVEITFRLLPELEGVLAPGGRALVLFDAGVERTPLAQRILTAVKPRGPVGLVVSIAGYLPPDAVAFLTAAVSSGYVDDGYAAKASRYRAHLARSGIDRIAHVLLDLRRLPDSASSFAATVSWDRLIGLGGAALEQAWRGVELLGRGPAALLDTPLAIAEGARLRVEQPLADDAARSFTLSVPGGAIQEQVLDEQSVSVLRALAARGTVAAACEELAEPGRAAELRPYVLDLVRRLVLHGVLAPALIALT